MTVAPSSKALSLAMSMVARARWRVPAQVIDLVRACTIDDPTFPRDELVLLGRDQVSDWFHGDEGDSRKHVRDVMVRLADVDRVLRRVPGSGRRPDAWGINTLREWRNVPWSVPRELALMRVELACAPPNGPQGSASGAIHSAPLPGVEARFIPRPYGPVVARSTPRHNDLPRGATWTAPQPSSGAGAHLSSSERELSLEGGRESIDVVKRAITARTGAAIWGQQLPTRIAALLELHPPDALVAWVGSSPDGAKPPAVVAHLEQVASATAPSPKGPDHYRRRAMAIRAHLEHLDDDDDQAQVLAAELAECENQLAAMNGSHHT
jgi:hypothetical protein